MVVGVAAPGVGHAAAANGGGCDVNPPSAGPAAASADGKLQQGEAAKGVLVIDLTGDSSDDADQDEEVKWVGQYSSSHSILLVGEGDFSFSLALAVGFGSGANLVATSLDSYKTLKNKYSQAEINLEKLKKLGAMILHGVNAKTMKLHTDLKMRRFDRVVFNFPHSGFRGREDQPHMINSHRGLVKDFFRNASHLLRPNGEVHVSHKTKDPYNKWNLEDLASEFCLLLFEQVEFHIQDYPGYNNKRGGGLNCDEPFLLGKCSTFKFRVGDIKKMERARKLGLMSHSGISRVHPDNHLTTFCPHPTPYVPEWPQLCSESLVHQAVQRCLAEAGCIPHLSGSTAGTIPPDHSWYQRTPVLQDFAKKQASLRVLIMLATHGRNSGMDLRQLLASLYNCSRAMLGPTGSN